MNRKCSYSVALNSRECVILRVGHHIVRIFRSHALENVIVSNALRDKKVVIVLLHMPTNTLIINIYNYLECL